MKITGAVGKISKTVQRDLTFILNALSESSIHFAYFSIVLAKKDVVSFTKNCFHGKRGCVTMRNYARTSKGIGSHNLVYNFLVQLLLLQSSILWFTFQRHFGMGTRHFQKVDFRMKLLLSM